MIWGGNISNHMIFSRAWALLRAFRCKFKTVGKLKDFEEISSLGLDCWWPPAVLLWAVSVHFSLQRCLWSLCSFFFFLFFFGLLICLIKISALKLHWGNDIPMFLASFGEFLQMCTFTRWRNTGGVVSWKKASSPKGGVKDYHTLVKKLCLFLNMEKITGNIL